MPVLTDIHATTGHEPDGPFQHLIVAGETRVPADGHWHVWRPHGMEGWILHCNLSGSGSVLWGDERITTNPGEVMLFAPEAVHDYDRAADAAGWIHRWAYFRPRPHWRDWLRWPDMHHGIARLQLDEAAAATCAQHLAAISAITMSGQPLREERAVNRLELLLIDLCGQWRERSGRTGDERVLAACTLIDERFAEALGVADVAAAVGLSPSRLSHLFQDHLGMGLVRYRDEMRMLRARQLLRSTGMPIRAVAAAVGYDDPLYFARAFRRLVGASPSAFRTQTR